MNPDKWTEIIEASANLKKPAMVSGIIPTGELSDYLQLLQRVLIEFTRRNKPHNGLKIFVNQLQDNIANQNLIDDLPKANEGLRAWGQRFFSGQPYGMIMNFLEEYNNDLVQKVALGTQPLLQGVGWPLAGLSMLFFMGDYGFTPFGVHRGSPGEDGFLFHLGPGEKTFYTWDTQEYLDLTNGAEVYKNVQEILHAAKAHHLKPGDAMFIPDDVYHVANTPEFSASLILDYRRASMRRIKEMVLNKLDFAVKESELFLDPISSEHLELPQDAKVKFDENIRDAYRDHLSILKSHGGFYQPAIRERINLSANSLFKLKRPFKLIAECRGESIKIFSRGQEIWLRNSPGLIDIIERFNDYQQYPMKQIDLWLKEGSHNVSSIEMMHLLCQSGIFEYSTVN